MKNISVLCKVVDNYGDIGVAWRLCRELLQSQIKINQINYQVNLIVDDLQSFHNIWKNVTVEKDFQTVEGINIYNWNSYSFCYDSFKKNDGQKLEIILECFQCGRPSWMEKILFEDKLNRTINIIMIDYLTAEKYAEDFHCLKSLTRSSKVQKVNFMPGFTERTGGLLIGQDWEKLSKRNKDGPVLLFTYERNWNPLASAFYEVQQNVKNQIYIAKGRGQASLKEGFRGKMQFTELDYLNQSEWDQMMKNCSVLFIRGEESLSRACLSGIPFVWHAYPQSDEYQLVKVNALLERMKNHFTDSDFEIIKNVWLCFNKPENEVSEDEFKNCCKNFLLKTDNLEKGYYSFAQSLIKNGNLADNLLDFIKNI